MAVDINLLHPTLKKAYENAKAAYIAKHPDLPRPILIFTHRADAVQAAFFAQGRQTLAAVNALRKAAGLYLLNARENGRKVTNAKPGQSPHNFLPALAFDVAFTPNGGKTIDWSEPHFHRFAPFVLQYPGLEWGGAWKTFVDLPHFQLRLWKNYAAPLPAHP